jgi:hypothetical protein
MFPQSMNQFPSAARIYPFPSRATVDAGTSANITADGSITLTVTPSIGFQIQLDALGSQLVNTKVVASFKNALTIQVGASSSSCQGGYYELLYTLGINILLNDPLPGWITGAQNINVYSRTVSLRPMTCYPWSNSNPNSRSIGDGMAYSPATTPLERRIVNPGALFSDLLGSSLRCSNNINTPTGNCNVNIMNEGGGDPTDGGAISKRDIVAEAYEAYKVLGQLEKRDSRKQGFVICQGDALIVGPNSPPFPSSKELINGGQPFVTYGPTNPSDCDDYGELICYIICPFASETITDKRP